MKMFLRLLVFGLLLGSCYCWIPKILYEGPVEAECLGIPRTERGNYLPRTMPPPDGSPFSLSRHHVIPLSRLRVFYNTALERSNQDNFELSLLIGLIGELAQQALDFYHDNNAQVHYALTNHLTVARNIHANYTYGFGDPPIEALLDVTVIIRNMFLWMPANIFWGPITEIRTDDPGDNFETNAGFIIGNRNFDMLRRINQRMIEYIAADNRQMFYDIITELQILARNQRAPYTFQLNQWKVTRRRGQERYYIDTRRSKRCISKRSTTLQPQQDDPFCLKPLEHLKVTLKEKNLVIAAAIVERVRRAKKFCTRDFESWKDWYSKSSWTGAYYNGIYWNGRSKAGAGAYYQAFGQIFNDGSFAVGLTGMDAKLGDDNWVTERGSNWGSSTDSYCGEMYFDKSGRPVALVISSRFYADFGSGWSFIYKNGRWQYESTDEWDERLFGDRTVSLDPHAPVFLIEASTTPCWRS